MSKVSKRLTPDTTFASATGADRGRWSLAYALLAAMTLALLVGLVPAGILLDRRLARSLEERARIDLELAPRLLADRQLAYSDAQMMHAKELAHEPGLAEAVARGDQPSVLRIIERVREGLGAALPVVVSGSDSALIGPLPDQPLITATRAGEMPVTVSSDGLVIRTIALAPLHLAGRWVGAAGVATPLDDQEAERLSGLTRSDVIVVSSLGDTITATTLDHTLATSLYETTRQLIPVGAMDLTVGGARYMAVRGELGDAGFIFFVRALDDELAVLPTLRRTAALASLGATILALLLGWLFAMRVSRPVRELATAADALGDGRFDAPLPSSQIIEVSIVAVRFEHMRRALAARLEELRLANEALKDRSERLSALQSDLMQRERLAVAGRLVAQLAHEIRNPVASLRNCLELVRRRVTDDPEALEFADLAINELLRMHELAEQMLDVSRPRHNAPAFCRPVTVAHEVARLITAGVADSELQIHVSGNADVEAPIASDALKQVLLNMIQNAREAAREGEDAPGVLVDVSVEATHDRVRIIVDDNGPGISDAAEGRLFDPFFSTKADLHGVGLGLFVAEGLVRRIGGRLSVDRSPGGGARFVMDFPDRPSSELAMSTPSEATRA